MKKKETDTLLDKLPTCAVEFIKLVIKKMRYRKKVRAEVMAELAAHFEDELADCQTEQEKEQKARQLIDEFGDVKLLGVLLRRAKKRCRPLWRKVLVRSFQAVGIIVLYIVICIGRLGIGTPTISVNYVDWLNELVRENREKSENAKLYYDQAAELYIKCPAAIEKKRRGCGYDVNSNWPSDFNDVEKKQLSKWLADNKPAFEKVREGAEKLYFWPIYESNEPELMRGGLLGNAMEPLAGYKNIARALDWQIQYKIYRADIESALNDCVVLQNFGSGMQGKGLLIEQLVGTAIEGLALQRIFMVLRNEDVPVDMLKRFSKELENGLSSQGAIIDLEAEKAFWYDLVQRGFTDDGKGGGRVLKGGVPFVVGDWKNSVWQLVSFSLPDRREFVAMIDNHFQWTEDLFEKTPCQLRNEEQLLKQLDEIEKESLMLQILGPAHRHLTKIVWRIRTIRTALLTVLATLVYEKEMGEYPADLNQLVLQGYLKQLPMDPYSDKPLVYKKADNKFLLYSVGMNFTDDGGKVAKRDNGRVKKYAGEGNWVFWPVSK